MREMFLSIIFLLLSTTAFAGAQSVCKNRSFDNYTLECLKIVGSNYVDLQAADFCSSLSFDQNKNDCLKVVMAKTYSKSDIAVCRGFSFDTGKIDCMKNSGRDRGRFSANAEETFRRIESIAYDAEDAIRSGKWQAALRSISKIERLAGESK